MLQKLLWPIKKLKMIKYTFNENIFSVIDTPEKAYWAGFLYADGYLTD